ncbi:MAG: tetratricopeptide repeat protein, partial [Gemmatimonadales bacterium]
AKVMTRIWRGRALRLAGRLDESVAEYRVVGALARSIGFEHGEFRGRIGLASTYKKKGNLPEAERLAREVRDEAAACGDRLMEAMALHNVGECLTYQGRDSEAIPLLFAAFEIYEDKTDRTRALSDLGTALKHVGECVAARHAFSLALRHCATVEMRINTMLELLEVAASIDDSKAFADWKSKLDAVRNVMQPDATVDFYIKMGQGFSMFGDVDEASICLRKAISLAENHDLNTYLFRAEQLLERLGDVAAEPRGTSAREGGTHPEVKYVAARLETLVVGAAAG